LFVWLKTKNQEGKHATKHNTIYKTNNRKINSINGAKKQETPKKLKISAKQKRQTNTNTKHNNK